MEYKPGISKYSVSTVSIKLAADDLERATECDYFLTTDRFAITDIQKHIGITEFTELLA
jgi:hypothetical protein